jgi:hypothetical protein
VAQTATLDCFTVYHPELSGYGNQPEVDELIWEAEITAKPVQIVR